MSGWSPKRAGFDSGGCGERSFNVTPEEPRIPDFWEWRACLLASMARENIPVQQRPDNTIVAKFGSVYRAMDFELQKENYEIWKAKQLGKMEAGIYA